MTITPETELKRSLTKPQFQAILAAYPFAPQFKQTNTYFDTPHQELRQHEMGLRIRQFDTYAEQTLKTPNPDHQGLIENTDPLTPAAAEAALQAGHIVSGGIVSEVLTKFGIEDKTLVPFAKATTYRQLATLPTGVITLDETHYPDSFIDYDLEIEYENLHSATELMAQLTDQFQLSTAPLANKVARAAKHVIKSQA